MRGLIQVDAAAGGLGRTTNGGDGSRADPARHGDWAAASIDFVCNETVLIP